MQAFFLLGPTSSIDGSNRQDLFFTGPGPHFRCRNPLRWRWDSTVVASFTVNGSCQNQNHYAVLGVSPAASTSDIKKAYRLLALKYHPDVSKDSRADELFKSVRLAYDVLSNETTRKQYDRAICYRGDTVQPWGCNWDYGLDYEDGVRVYRWADLKQRMRHGSYWEGHYAKEESSSFYNETDDLSEEILDKERGSFIEVLKSTFLSLFLMQTIGARLSLTFSSLMALLDRKLDAGYKVGYLIAWILGGRAGILLTLCLSFASWICGKTSSSLVALVVVAMWVGSNLARYAPLPQGALLTLLYMSIKLQVDSN